MGELVEVEPEHFALQEGARNEKAIEDPVFRQKALAFLLSVLVLSLAVFYVSRLAPGDPLVSYYGDRAEKLTPQERAQAEEKLGLDEPIFTQYVRWAQNALRGDFGISYKYKMPAAEVIASRAGNTLLLGGIGFVLIFTLSLLLGMLCARREERFSTARSASSAPSRAAFRNSGCRCCSF